MTIVDPANFFGIDSGMRRVQVSKAEAATLLRAAAIADRAHELVVGALGEQHYDLPDATDLCLAGESLRNLANGEVEW